MKIINWKNKEAVKVAVKVINSGGILVYPTDTIYGFGVNAKDPIPIDKLNVLKNRTGPISVIAPDRATVSTWLNVKEKEKLHAASHLGAQNTIIYPVKKISFTRKSWALIVHLALESQTIHFVN